ncbi:hypothetical protein K9M48_00650 [Candidatus Gracilibacteria bacterium]|nr:hypothetical protein [Candidatus Gracilibacteria bacterium]
MKIVYHKDLANGRWYKLTFAQQMGNIGSEIYRSLQAKEKYPERFEQASDRMLELFDLTLSNPKCTSSQRKETARLREGICSYLWGENEYDLDPNFLNKYFFAFGLIANQ